MTACANFIALAFKVIFNSIREFYPIIEVMNYGGIANKSSRLLNEQSSKTFAS